MRVDYRKLYRKLTASTNPLTTWLLENNGIEIIVDAYFAGSTEYDETRQLIPTGYFESAGKLGAILATFIRVADEQLRDRDHILDMIQQYGGQVTPEETNEILHKLDVVVHERTAKDAPPEPPQEEVKEPPVANTDWAGLIAGKR